MSISIQNSELHIINMQTRLPFKFGISTMTAVPHLILQLSLKINGKQCVGFAAGHLPPKWFTKGPASSLREEVEDMITNKYIHYDHSVNSGDPNQIGNKIPLEDLQHQYLPDYINNNKEFYSDWLD